MDKTPAQLAEERVELSAYYAHASKQLESILEQKPKVWLDIRQREGVKSAAEADREWEATEDGINEMKLKMKMKRMEKRMSAISSLLRVYEVEGRNQW